MHTGLLFLGTEDVAIMYWPDQTCYVHRGVPLDMYHLPTFDSKGTIIKEVLISLQVLSCAHQVGVIIIKHEVSSD